MSLVNLDLVFKVITNIAGSQIKDKFQRNETVIKLRKLFNIEPDHPPADFSGVYDYALAEYGVGKPRPVAQLFRQKVIKKAFRQAFDNNNASILLSEVYAFIDAYALGDRIKYLKIDIRQEIEDFYRIFEQVAQRTRNPADAMLSQQIGNLSQCIAHSVLQTLDSGIPREMGRLTTQNYPLLPRVEPFTENTCRAITLAQQMHGWFKTLGYVFEKYENWRDSYFEWIINIQGRHGYERILVRGIEGEAGVQDITDLAELVKIQKTDEGWLVSNRRISQAARNQVAKDDYSQIFCYTFDELLDQNADFSGYLDWLETEIKERKVDIRYVPLACTNEEVDPDTQRQIAVSRYDEENGWIDGYIDRWLDDPTKEHISILGEFGTGKTWFTLYYAWVALQRYRNAQKLGVQRPRLPLVVPLRDYPKAGVSVESLFSDFFFRKHQVGRLLYPAFEQLNRMGKLLLIFDGFDEMAAKVDRQQMINHFWELAKVVVPGAKVILTCRTEHFPEAKEGRALLNSQLPASTTNLTREKPRFEVLELEKFNDKQIKKVLSFQAESTTVEQVMNNPQLLDLARRPIMTDLILEALPDIEAGKPVDMSRVYLYAARRKMERDIKAERTFTSLADKLYFLCELSWEMLSTDQMSLNYRQFPDRIRQLFGANVQKEKDLDHWHYDMMGQTMLIRNYWGDYTPAHRSLLEFFVAYKFAAELGALADDFTELARSLHPCPEDIWQSCLDESAAPVEYTWSSYFSRHLDETGNCVVIPSLKGFTSESLEKLRKTFGRAPLTKAVIDLMLGMIADNEALIRTIEATRHRSENRVDYVGGNAATLAVKVDKRALEKRDFSGTVVRGADFSNASLRCVNFSEANLADSSFTKIFGTVWSVAFSPDGKLFATGDGNGRVSLWEAASGKENLTWKGHSHWVRSVAFSPQGNILASGSDDKTIRLWDISTHECLQTFRGHTDWVYSIAFSPQGDILASGSRDKTVRLWNITTGECLQTFEGHTNWVHSIAFSPQGNILASGSRDQTVRLWNINSGECSQILQGHTNWVFSVAFTSQGNILASGSEDKTLRLWSISTGECLQTLQGHTSLVYSIAFSPDGSILASGSGDQTVRLWDISTGECLQILRGHTNLLRSVAFSPDGTTLISGSEDQTLGLWDISTGECLRTLQGYTNWVRSVAFSPQGNILASSSRDQTVRLWDISSGECLYTLQGHSNWVRSVAFSPQGNTLASGSADQTVRLWDVSSGEYLYTLQGHSHWIGSVAFSPDGLILASGSRDQTVRLWNISSGKCLHILEGHTDWVRSVAFSPQSNTLASASGDQTVRLWDINSGECLQIFQGHTDWVRLVAFSPQGNTLVSTSADQTVRLWDISSTECLKILQGHTNRVYSAAFSPDGATLASGSGDQTVRLWDISTGECLHIFEGHSNCVHSVAFSPQGNILASGSDDETIKLWDVKTVKCLKTLRNEQPYKGMNITGIKGLTDAEKFSLKALGAVENEEL